MTIEVWTHGGTAASEIAADATASIAGRAAAAVQTAIAGNPMVAGVVAGAIGVAAGGVLVYYGGRYVVDAASAGYDSVCSWFRSSDQAPAANLPPQDKAADAS